MRFGPYRETTALIAMGVVGLLALAMCVAA